MKIEKIAENDNLEVYKFVETEIIVAVIDRKEKKATIVHGSAVIEEYYGIENAEDVEKITEENKFNLMVRTATILTLMHNNQNTK